MITAAKAAHISVGNGLEHDLRADALRDLPSRFSHARLVFLSVLLHGTIVKMRMGRDRLRSMFVRCFLGFILAVGPSSASSALEHLLDVVFSTRRFGSFVAMKLDAARRTILCCRTALRRPEARPPFRSCFPSVSCSRSFRREFVRAARLRWIRLVAADAIAVAPFSYFRQGRSYEFPVHCTSST